MTEIRLPYRPRLGDYVMVRRQIVAGVVKPCLVDSRNGMLYVLTEQELEHVLALDGTRDFGGVILKVVQAGHFRRASEIKVLLGQMQEAGLLVDGIAPPDPEPERHPERPLEALPGYRLRCDAVGSCCTTFASVPFSEAEMQRAAAAAPELIDAPLDRVFLPVWGSVDRSMVAVTMRDGQCPFLSDSARCVVHERAGSDAKPLGCTIFPKSFADDGEAVRVSVQVECACVMASAALAEEGEALLDGGVTTEGDLHRRVHITRLPDEIRTHGTSSVPRGALRAWSEAVCRADVNDGVAAFWRLADSVETAGLDPAAARDAAESASPPTAEMLARHLEALADLAAVRHEAAAERAARDRIRVLAEWAELAARTLRDPEIAAQRLAEVPHPERERFYLRAVVWGHHLAERRLSLAQALRDRALRLLLARQMARTISPAAQADPSAAFPITGMEAMMRGQALERYADAIG